MTLPTDAVAPWPVKATPSTEKARVPPLTDGLPLIEVSRPSPPLPTDRVLPALLIVVLPARISELTLTAPLRVTVPASVRMTLVLNVEPVRLVWKVLLAEMGE